MAAGSTYTPIATNTLGSATSTVTFSSISGSYTDLRLVMSGTLPAGSDITLNFNGDSSALYSRTYIVGDGSATGSGRTSNSTTMPAFYIGATSTYSAFADIMNYANTTTFKTVLCRSGDTGSYVEANIGLYRSTSAITSITIAGGSFQAGSTFTLYGIASA